MRYSIGDRITYQGLSGKVTSYSNSGNSVWIYLDVGIGHNVDEYMLKPEEPKKIQTSLQVIRFKVELMFVSPEQDAGYMIEHLSMAETKEQAISEAVLSHLDEKLPLSGIVIWESQIL